MKTLRIFACGGSATNVVASLLQSQKDFFQNRVNMECEVVLVDSSDSNFKKYEDQFLKEGVELYRIPDMDGAGQVRGNMRPELIKPHVDLVLNRFNAGDINIVMHSCSGGSGSMIGPMLARALLEAGKPTVVSMIGDVTTQNFANNTANTIATYDNISRNVLRKPIVATYSENTAGVLHQRINETIIKEIMEISVLFSGLVHGVDTKDLANLLDYTNIAQVDPELSLIRTTLIENNDYTELMAKLQKSRVVAMARISNQSSSIDIPCSFRIEGTFGHDFEDSNVQNRIYTVEQGYFVHEVQRHRDLVKQYQTAAAALSNKRIDLGHADDSGMIY